jgi:chemotaxis protein methyltransferase WspC
VSFARGNVLERGFLAGTEPYDVIFCRNLLIYFDLATQERAIEVLRRLLAPRGLLFVGPAEAGLLFGHGFVWSKVPLSFCFAQAPAAFALAAQPALPARLAVAPYAPQRATTNSAALVKTAAAGPPRRARAPSPAEPVSLEAATALADAGQLREAALMCDAHLRATGPSARGFYLRALIYSAAGSSMEAIGSLRRALYLDPAFVAAIAHLALLLESGGNVAEAALLRDRLRRHRASNGVLAR